MSHNPTYKVLNSNLFFNPKLPHLILKKKKNHSIFIACCEKYCEDITTQQ